jgi:hypothetical protein
LDSTIDTSLNLSAVDLDKITAIPSFTDEVDETISELYKLIRLDSRIPLTYVIWVISDLRELALTAYQRGKEEGRSKKEVSK